MHNIIKFNNIIKYNNINDPKREPIFKTVSAEKEKSIEIKRT